MTTLKVKVTTDKNGRRSVEFDREKLLSMPLENVMREVSEEAKRAQNSTPEPGPDPQR
jgi:hypothetical protein